MSAAHDAAPPAVSVGVVCSIGAGPERGGRVRNEDNYLVCRDGEVRWREDDAEAIGAARGTGVLLAVADGMGGHEDGALASTVAVRTLSAFWTAPPDRAPELALHRYVLAAHRRLHDAVARRGKVRMGTTLTCAWVVGGWLYWVHVGDSRLYLHRDGAMERLTTDHTRRLFAQRDRRPLPTDPDRLAQNFIYGSRGLGDDRDLRIDPGLDTGARPLRTGDRLVLCSDGLSGFVDDASLADALREVASPAACAQVLVDRAIAWGSDDNVTVVVARVDRGAAPARVLGRDDTLVPL